MPWRQRTTVLKPEVSAPPAYTNWGASVTVTLWDVLMAIRYGMGRHTYANADASSLAKQVWPLFDVSVRNQLRRDASRLSGPEAEEWAWLT